MRAKSFDTHFGAPRALPAPMNLPPLPADLTTLSDEVLIETLQRTCLAANRLLGRLIRLLIEVDNRRLHLRGAHPSLFEYCRKDLRMSEGEAFRRINAARLVRKFPELLPRIERGDVHLTALVTLRDYFTADNVDDLVDAAKGKNKFALSELVALLAPRPDVPARLRKIPQHDKGSRVTNAPRGEIEALAEALYRLQVTGNRAFRDKLFRARDLLMHTNPKGDLSVVVDRALDSLIAQLEKQRYGKPLSKITQASIEPVAARAPASASPARKAATRDAAATRPPANKRATEREKRPGLARAGSKQKLGKDEMHRSERGARAVANGHLRRRKSREGVANGAATRGH